MTMQIATIDDSGTQFAYLDSGSLPNETYTTLVIVHGHTYHAENFSKLLPIAKDHNIRVIALNRRDYVGSTPFSEEELKVINDKDDVAHHAFLQARGFEIARFLSWAITEKRIPRATADGNLGGLALLGWSLGNLTTMAFMRHLKSYPSDVVQTIEPYLKAFYIYECGAGTLGYPSPQGGYHPLNDSTIPSRMRGVYFGTWVSSYYKHSYYSGAKESERAVSALQVRSPEGDHIYRPSTLDTLAPGDLMRCVDSVPAARSEQPFMSTINRALMYDQTEGVLTLDHTSAFATAAGSSNEGDLTSKVLPNVNIFVMYGSATVWSVPWCVWELEKDYERWQKDGRKLRPLRYLPVDGANHFLHWDDPDVFLGTIENGLKS